MRLNYDLVMAWLRQFRVGLQVTETFLQPEVQICRFCGGLVSSKRGKFHIQQLCVSCSEQIQWIASPKCETCGRGESCEDCGRRQETYFTASRSSVRYTEQIRPWLARFKYRRDERLKMLLTDMMEYTFLQHYHNRKGILGVKIDLITYVPISEERFAERGFNQSQLLAEELGARIQIPVEPILWRTKHTVKQSYKSRAERLEAMKDAFDIRLNTRQRVITQGRRPLSILLIDDVYTTGSTLNACAKVIVQHLPAKVYGLTWAR